MEQNNIANIERTQNEHSLAIKEIEKRIGILEGSQKVLEYQFKTIMDNLQELKHDIKELKSTPSKRWDLIVTSAISVIVGSIISMLFKF